MQTNTYYQIKSIAWKHMIIDVRLEYLKPCNEIICIR